MGSAVGPSQASETQLVPFEEETNQHTDSSWFPSVRWRPTSMAALAQAERKILTNVWHLIENRFVSINNGTRRLRTISLNASAVDDASPLVLVHGMGSGVGLWTLNLESLSQARAVHAFDVMGFGRSSRPKFNSDAMLTEMEFVESIEEWRKEMGLEKFVMLGHSMGGFLAASYAIRYPERLNHLILVDPWGFPERPKDPEKRQPIPAWIRAVGAILSPFNPLAGLRVAGPWGPGLVTKFRPDLMSKFSDHHDDETVAQYIYHCNAQTPSGETGFKNLTTGMGWAKFPMIRRITEVQNWLPMTLVYGSRSWIDSGVGYEIKYMRNEAYVDVQVVKGAGHHVYADRASDFNNLVNRICKNVDLQRDRLDMSRLSAMSSTSENGYLPNGSSSSATSTTESSTIDVHRNSQMNGAVEGGSKAPSANANNS